MATAAASVLQFQQEQLQDLLRYVWKNSIFYRNYYRSHGIREFDLDRVTIEELPFLSKRYLMDRFDEAVTDRRLRKTFLETWIRNNLDPRNPFHSDFIVVHSSGSSGETGIFVYDRVGWQIMAGKVAQRIPPPDNFPEKTRVAFYVTAHANFTGVTTALELPSSLYDVLILSEIDSPERVIRLLNRFQPQRLIGYSSSISRLVQWTRNRDLNIKPRTVVVSGDPLTPAIAQSIQQMWGALIHELYMASESICLGVKRTEQDHFVLMDDLNILEILDEKNQRVAEGSFGRVVLTNLFNHALPILRYELRDYVIPGKRDPESQFATIRKIAGRVDDVLPIVSRDDEPGALEPEALCAFQLKGLKLVQFVSLSPRQIRIDYVAEEPMDTAIANTFSLLLERYNGTGTSFEIRRVADIPKDAETGKLRIVRPEGLKLGETSESLVYRGFRGDRNIQVVRDGVTPSNSFEPFPIEALEESIPKRFESVVQHYGRQPAVRTGKQIITYEALNREAYRIAGLLSASASHSGIVGILLNKDASLIAAILGVLKANRAYACLDTFSTEATLASILQDSEPDALLTCNSTLLTANRLIASRCRLINLDELHSQGSEMTPPRISPESIAYLVYSSGTARAPQGVVHTHRSAMHACMTQTNDFHISSNDRIGFLHSVNFNPAVRDILGALLNGACLLPFDLRANGFDRAPEWLAQEEVTVLSMVPTVFRQIVKHLNGQRLPALRLIDLVGEPVDRNDVELYRAHFGRHCLLVNSLGASECHVFRRMIFNRDVPVTTERAPCGFAVPDKDVYLVDGNGETVGLNHSGEIVVESRYLAAGFWKKPDLTRSTFLPVADKPLLRRYLTGDAGVMIAGEMLYHLGRVDSQIKIRGQRIDVEAVERAIRQISSIGEVAVIAATDYAGNDIFAAYYTAEPPAPSVSEIRNHVAALLPDHMVPSTYILLDAIPKTESGKVNSKAFLPANVVRVQPKDDPLGPLSETEVRLRGIWTEVLGPGHIGIHDHFLNVGGHSLSAMQILSRIRSTFGVDVPIRDFFNIANIAGLAQFIDAAVSKQ